MSTSAHILGSSVARGCNPLFQRNDCVSGTDLGQTGTVCYCTSELCNSAPAKFSAANVVVMTFSVMSAFFLKKML